MSSHTTPVRLDLKKDEKLEIEWQDGVLSTYSMSLLRSMCPCAICKEVRNERKNSEKKSLLTILPGNYSSPIHVISAELVGNYALRIEWSDQHGSGIYSFEYLRGIISKKS